MEPSTPRNQINGINAILRKIESICRDEDVNEYLASHLQNNPLFPTVSEMLAVYQMEDAHVVGDVALATGV